MIDSHVRFDSNEWAVSGYILLYTLLILRMPKRLPFSITLTMLVFSAGVARIFDHMLAGPFISDLYDIMDRETIEWFDMLTYVMYTPPSYFFIYYYDKWNPRGLNISLYILGWSSFAVGNEYLLSLADVYEYKEWSLAYSFLVYLFVQPLTLRTFEFLRKQYEVKKT